MTVHDAGRRERFDREMASAVYDSEAFDAFKSYVADLELSLSAERAAHAETHAQLASAIFALSEAGRRRGEAEGRIAALEIPGVVEGWRERALAAEFANAETRARCEALEAALRPFSTMPKIADYLDRYKCPDEQVIELQTRSEVHVGEVRVGDLRRAVAILDPKAREVGR